MDFEREGLTPPRPLVRRGTKATPVHARRAARKHPLLGELALRHGLVSPPELQKLLTLNRLWGTRFGSVLLSAGQATPLELARLVASQRGLPLVNLTSEAFDPDLLNKADISFYLSELLLPWRRADGEVIYVATDPVRAQKAIARRNGRLPKVYVTSSRDIQQAIATHFSDHLTARACFGLMRDMPRYSAARRTTGAQRRALALLLVLFGLALSFSIDKTLMALNVMLGFCFLCIAALRCASIIIGQSGAPSREELAYAQSKPITDKELPVYTIIVPLFREAAVLPLIAGALRDLNYPAAKLDIKLVFEASDPETLRVAKLLNLPGHFEFITVPDSQPRTKPKACNYALPFARGTYVVIFDAEDLPEPDQLRKAASAFALGDPRLACVQAQLNFYNWNENWLTRQFALEYGAFFDLLLPTLDHLRLPIPLGGTSTHFRLSALRESGGWDAHNVTEDADLGMRLAALGYRCGIIRSTTEEEANCQLHNWIRQRSRWIKGWVQTYFVHMRDPLRLWRALGWRGFLGFQIVIGGFSLSNLVHPFFYVGAIYHAWLSNGGIPFGSDPALVLFNLSVLTTGYVLAIIAAMVAVARRGLAGLIPVALTMPAYWLLISLASYKAMFQFLTRPFHWEKTHHGLSRMAQKRPFSPDIISLTPRNRGR